MKIAIQLYSLRDEMVKDFEGTLKKVSEMGYEMDDPSMGKTPLECAKISIDYLKTIM